MKPRFKLLAAKQILLFAFCLCCSNFAYAQQPVDVSPAANVANTVANTSSSEAESGSITQPGAPTLFAALADRIEDTKDRIADVQTDVTLFGVLLTVLVVFFSLKTEQSAVHRASETARQIVQKQLAEIERCVTQAKAHSESASATLDEIRGLRGKAAEVVEEMQKFGPVQR